MNIRRISTVTTAATALGIFAVTTIGAGGAQAAGPCFEQGPNGPVVVDCPIVETGFTPVTMPIPGALQQIIDGLLSVPDTSGVGDPEGEGDCTLELVGGISTPIDCDVLAAMTDPTIAGIGDIVFDPTAGGTDEAPADQPSADDGLGDIDAPVDETADEQFIEEQPVEEQPVEEQLTAEQPARDDTVDTTEGEAVTESPTADTSIEVDQAEVTPTIEVGQAEVTPTEVTEPTTGALPRTGAGLVALTLGLSLMGVGAGTFAKLAAARRRH